MVLCDVGLLTSLECVTCIFHVGCIELKSLRSC